jgi:hypothetical protein
MVRLLWNGSLLVRRAVKNCKTAPCVHEQRSGGRGFPWYWAPEYGRHNLSIWFICCTTAPAHGQANCVILPDLGAYFLDFLSERKRAKSDYSELSNERVRWSLKAIAQFKRAKENTVLTKVNPALTKENTILTKVNTILTKVNPALTKENTVLTKKNTFWRM